jgi:hypothetical protein
MTRHLMWINEKEGWIAFQYKINGEHYYYEYLQIGDQPLRTWPKL